VLLVVVEAAGVSHLRTPVEYFKNDEALQVGEPMAAKGEGALA